MYQELEFDLKSPSYRYAQGTLSDRSKAGGFTDERQQVIVFTGGERKVDGSDLRQKSGLKHPAPSGIALAALTERRFMPKRFIEKVL